MELRRFFVEKSDIDGELISVAGNEFEHMTKVLRLKTGFSVIVCANDGVERLCEIQSVSRDFAVLRIKEEKTLDFKNINLTLFAGLLKNNKLDFTVQKAVELGVDKIVPFVSANSAEKKFNAERANRIALEAAKQCGSVYLSEVSELTDFDGVCRSFEDFDTVVIAYEGEKRVNLKNIGFKGKSIALVVGCEGGFKQSEIEKALACGALTVSLGRRILRAETAGIVACALTLNALGELDNFNPTA
jgi:16S rRNA (uracil1498-N3)-methyltransferase